MGFDHVHSSGTIARDEMNIRVALRQENALTQWARVERGVSSALILTESIRTLDRARLRANLSDPEIARRRATILALIDSLELVEVDSVVLHRAAQPTRFISPQLYCGKMRPESNLSLPRLTPRGDLRPSTRSKSSGNVIKVAATRRL